MAFTVCNQEPVEPLFIFEALMEKGSRKCAAIAVLGIGLGIPGSQDIGTNEAKCVGAEVILFFVEQIDAFTAFYQAEHITVQPVGLHGKFTARLFADMKDGKSRGDGNGFTRSLVIEVGIEKNVETEGGHRISLHRQNYETWIAKPI